MTVRCDGCEWWASDEKTKHTQHSPNAVSYRAPCRKPIPVASPNLSYGVWPLCKDSDWCGAFAAIEVP